MEVGKGGKIILGLTGLAVAGGCAGGLETKLVRTHEAAALRSAEVEAVEVADPVAAAKNLLEDYTKDYDANIKADSEINMSPDLAMLAKYSNMAKALLANDSVKKSDEALAIIGQVSSSVNALQSRYASESGFLRLFVDAEQRSNGRRANFGQTNPNGGYVVQLPGGLESVFYAVAASSTCPENVAKDKLMANAEMIRLGTMKEKPKSVSDKDYKEAQAYVARTDVKDAIAYANDVVKELGAEAVTEVVVPGRSVEVRDKVSTQVSYENLRAIVHMYSVNQRMRRSIDRLAPGSNGIFKICDDGCNVQYVAGSSVKLSADDVANYHPGKFAPAPKAEMPAAAAGAAK